MEAGAVNEAQQAALKSMERRLEELVAQFETSSSRDADTIERLV